MHQEEVGTGARRPVPATSAPSSAARSADELCAQWRRHRPRYLELFAGDLVALQLDDDALEMSFTVAPEWGHTLGLQGGIVAGMLESAMTQCVILCSRFELTAPTLASKISYLAPARPGSFRAFGFVEHRMDGVAFVRGELQDASGALVATATATTRLLANERTFAL